MVAAVCALVFGCASNERTELLLLDETVAQGSCSVGATVEVELRANPTTGYVWSVVEDGAPALKFEKSRYEPSEPQLAGSGGTSVFFFTAKSPADAALKFKYSRPWEKNGDSKTLEFKVSVSE